MGSRIYTSLKPFIPKDTENTLQKADKSYTTKYYSIKYPKEWRVLENIDKMTDAYIGSKQEDFGFTIIRFETDYSLSKAHIETNENIKQAGFRIISDKQITIAGRKCYETLQDGTLQGKRFKHLSYTFKKGDMLYNIKFGNLSNDKRKALANEIIASFRFMQ